VKLVADVHTAAAGLPLCWSTYRGPPQPPTVTSFPVRPSGAWSTTRPDPTRCAVKFTPDSGLIVPGVMHPATRMGIATAQTTRIDAADGIMSSGPSSTRERSEKPALGRPLSTDRAAALDSAFPLRRTP